MPRPLDGSLDCYPIPRPRVGAHRLIGVLLAETRRAGLTKEELCQRAGVPLPTLNNWAAGNHQPRISHLEAAFAVLGLTLSTMQVEPRARRRRSLDQSYGRRKLTLEQVNELRRVADRHSRRELAEMFGISVRQVQHIVSGQSWR